MVMEEVAGSVLEHTEEPGNGSAIGPGLVVYDGLACVGPEGEKGKGNAGLESFGLAADGPETQEVFIGLEKEDSVVAEGIECAGPVVGAEPKVQEELVGLPRSKKKKKKKVKVNNLEGRHKLDP